MAIPDNPENRKEQFLANMAGQSVSVPNPQNRLEDYLSGISSRMDRFLSELAEVKASGGTVPAEAIAEMQTSIRVVNSLPESGEENVVYLVPTGNTITNARFAKYIWVDGGWEALSVAETILSVIDAWERQMYWKLYGSVSGFLLIYQGRALNKVTTDLAYAGMTAQLTIISALGESTSSVEIGVDGEIPIGCFANVKTGFNLIFCETDPAQKDGDKLVGPTAIPLTAIYYRGAAEFADMTFSQFLAVHNLRRQYVLVEPRPTELDPNRKYFIRFYEEFQPIWEALDTTNGYYFVGIDALSDALDKDIFMLELLRTRESDVP